MSWTLSLILYLIALLPCKTPPSLQNIYTLLCRPALLFLFAIYPCKGRSETDRYGEKRIEASIQTVSSWSRLDESDRLTLILCTGSP